MAFTHPTRSLCDHFLSKMNIQTDYYDPAIAPEALAQAFRPNTSLLYMESPSSLTFEMQDVPNLAALAREKGAKSIIDQHLGNPLFISARSNMAWIYRFIRERNISQAIRTRS